IEAATKELPGEKHERYLAAGVREAEADLIAPDRDMAEFFDAALEQLEASDLQATPQQVANWLGSDVAGQLNAAGTQLADSQLTPEALVALVNLVAAGDISGRTGKDLLPEVLDGADPEQLVAERGLKAISDEGALQTLVDGVIGANPELVERVRKNPKAINALLGLVMKESRGTARPDVVRELLSERLNVS
ncbi:MAG TPA: Asp-tRNA(Asn)/Glu-tRNA(Gln) amidotransferase GatCAB subunit B, partial [Deinococcales bacterium]|nr:Asp-tRNA(Asn)/Glu-tRNA(Gln) amidotransferase GatCAB subunit B [Deinococcales bacterium]